LDAVEAHFASIQTSDRNAVAQEMLQFFRQRPEFEQAGLVGDGSVWARFTDGRLVSVINNRETGEEGPPPAGRAFSAAQSRMVPGTLPATARIALLDGFGPETNPYGQIGDMLQAQGYTPVLPPAYQNLTVENLKQVQNCGLFYLSGHSTRARLRSGEETVIFFTRTRRTRELENAYKADLDEGALCYAFVRHRPDQEDAYKVIPDYAFTPRFVRKYMSFSADSLVVFDSCSSSHAELTAACRDKGASVIAGWSNPVQSSDAFKSMTFLFDRLLGANQASPQETPPQRPFDYEAVYADMERRNLVEFDYTADRGFKTRLILTSDQGSFAQLAPSIQNLVVEERNEQLVLNGAFGNEPGFVSVGGSVLAIRSWTPTEIVCTLPPSGAGSAGDVLVTVNNHRSNVVQLTEWKGQVRYTLTERGSLTQRFVFDVRFRGDVHAFRYDPGQEPLAQGGVFTATPNSTCKYEFSGNWNNGAGTTVDWSGSGSMGPDYRAQPGESALTLQGYLQGNRLELLLNGMVAKGLVVHTLWKTPDGEVIENKTEREGASALVGQVVENMPGGLRLTLDQNFNASGGHIEQSGDNVRVTIDWDAFTASYPPDDRAGRSVRSGRKR
jgi:hypothetical protein